MAKTNLKEDTQAQASLHPGSGTGGGDVSTQDPKTRLDWMSAIVGKTITMTDDELLQMYNGMMGFAQEAGHGQGIPDGIVGANQGSIKTKPSAAIGEAIEQNFKGLFEGLELSDEFKAKTKALFEGAIASHTAEITVRLQKEYDERLEQQLAEAAEAVVEKVDAYLQTVVEEWLTENKVAVRSTIRSELMEDFFRGFRGLMETHWIEIPDDKVDLAQSLAEKVVQLEEKLDESISNQASLKKDVSDRDRLLAINEAVRGLTDLDAEKLKGLLESIAWDKNFVEKAKVIKDKFIGEAKGKTGKKSLTENVTVDANNLIEETTVVTQDIKVVETKSDPLVQSATRLLNKAY